MTAVLINPALLKKCHSIDRDPAKRDLDFIVPLKRGTAWA
jgi:hypothetical protein